MPSRKIKLMLIAMLVSLKLDDKLVGMQCYLDSTKNEHFAATLEGTTMTWFAQYGMACFVDYNTLKIAFLARFRKEKTLEDVPKKPRGL